MLTEFLKLADSWSPTTLLALSPLVGMVLALVWPGKDERAVRWGVFAWSLVPLGIALYLWLSTLIGQIGAVLILAGLHAVTALILTLIATRNGDSPELTALAETEEAAFEAMSHEAGRLTDLPGGVARLIGSSGGNLGLAVSAATTLLGIIQKMRAKPSA